MTRLAVFILGLPLFAATACAGTTTALAPQNAGAAVATGDSLPVTDAATLPDGRSAPVLRRVTHASALTGLPRQYFVHLPAGYATEREKTWPLILFLHGDGERGDGQADLDLLLKNGPLHEAAIKHRDLPFVIVAPQLPTHETFKAIGKDADEKMPRLNRKVDLDRRVLDEAEPWSGEGPPRGWPWMEEDVLSILETVQRDHRVDPQRIYLTGLSYGGYGTWQLAKRHPQKFTAIAPLCGAGGAAGFEELVSAQTPLWAFHGGVDTVILAEWQLHTVQALRTAGHKDARFTVHEHLGHNVWDQVYGGRDLYDWFLQHQR